MTPIQIAGLGLTTIDILLRMESMPTWEGGGNMDEIRLDGGGPVGTALVAAARLGASTGFIGTRGNDELGELKIRYLSRDGVDTSQVVVRPHPESQIIVVYVQSGTGERIFKGARNWVQQNLSPAELDRNYLTRASYLHLDGLDQPETLLTAIDWMHQAGKQVVLDAGKTNGTVGETMRQIVAGCDYLICGSGFGQALTGETGFYSIGKAALKLGPKVVVQTEGSEGSYTTSADAHFHTPAFPIDPVDTTGAGDVFHGAYLYGLVQGWSLEHIAIFSTAVAALKCRRLGGRVGIPTLHDTMIFLQDHQVDLTPYLNQRT